MFSLFCRTDAGVHALHSTVHVDLDGGNNRIIPANSITSALNHIFQVQNLPIHILNTENVPPTFHCRQSVKERKYMYRLAVAKEFYKPVDDGKKRKRKHRSLLHIGSNEIESIRKASHRKFKPIEELDRCLFILLDKFNDNNLSECGCSNQFLLPALNNLTSKRRRMHLNCWLDGMIFERLWDQRENIKRWVINIFVHSKYKFICWSYFLL